MEEIAKIFNQLRSGAITVETAEDLVLNYLTTFHSIEVSYECSCCYMTTGEHSSSCPKCQTPQL